MLQNLIKKPSYVFMGCKHCGKSTQGRLFAEKNNFDFYDVDEIIQRGTGMSARDVYKKKGITGFLLTEEAACKWIVKRCKESSDAKGFVISTGGGICDNAPALAALRECGDFVFLKLSVNASVRRILKNIEEVEPGVFTNVPAYVADASGKVPNSIDKIKDILTDKFTTRIACYEKIADIVIDIKNASVDDNFATITKALSN